MQSRYYDPTTCRFINADSYLSTGQGIIGYNTFAYCLNNPTENVDVMMFSSAALLFADKVVFVWPAILGELAFSYLYGSVKGFVKGIREAFS